MAQTTCLPHPHAPSATSEPTEQEGKQFILDHNGLLKRHQKHNLDGTFCEGGAPVIHYVYSSQQLINFAQEHDMIIEAGDLGPV